MKTLKMTLHAACVNRLLYECVVEAPDDTDPEDLIGQLHEALDGSEFVEDEFGGNWHSDGGEWEVVEDSKEQELPRWRCVPAEEGPDLQRLPEDEEMATVIEDVKTRGCL